MSERLEDLMEGLIRDLSSNKLELSNFVNDYFLLKESMNELKKRNESLSEESRGNFDSARKYRQEAERYKQVLVDLLFTDDIEVLRVVIEALKGE